MVLNEKNISWALWSKVSSSRWAVDEAVAVVSFAVKSAVENVIVEQTRLVLPSRKSKLHSPLGLARSPQ